MTTVLVLTGTTGYPALERSILAMSEEVHDIEFILQTPNQLDLNGRLRHESFLDLDKLDTSSIGLVIGHCGAGTVFWTLDRRLKFIAIVDLDRPDQHQADLGQWVSNNRYGLVLRNKAPSIADINRAIATEFQEYEPDAFRVDRLEAFLS